MSVTLSGRPWRRRGSHGMALGHFGQTVDGADQVLGVAVKDLAQFGEGGGAGRGAAGPPALQRLFAPAYREGYGFGLEARGAAERLEGLGVEGELGHGYSCEGRRRQNRRDRLGSQHPGLPARAGCPPGAALAQERGLAATCVLLGTARWLRQVVTYTLVTSPVKPYVVKPHVSVLV